MKRSDRNWTIVSIHYRHTVPISERYPFGLRTGVQKYVVEVGLKSEAKQIVEAWLDADPERRHNLDEVHYYPRTYVDIYHELMAVGRVIDRART